MILVDAVILAAGSGRRMKADCNKVFLSLCGKAVLLHTALAFEKSKSIDGIVVVAGADEIDYVKELLKDITKLKCVIAGGAERQQSSQIGANQASGEYVMIHDGARALITPDDIDSVAAEALNYGAAAVGTPCIDTMKRCESGNIISTVDRENLYKIYTPQCFRKEKFIELHEKAGQLGIKVTDDCALYEWGGETVRIVSGNPHNLKLTTPEDICIAETILSLRENKTE